MEIDLKARGPRTAEARGPGKNFICIFDFTSHDTFLYTFHTSPRGRG